MSVLNIPHLLLGVGVFIKFGSVRYFEFIISYLTYNLVIYDVN